MNRMGLFRSYLPVEVDKKKPYLRCRIKGFKWKGHLGRAAFYYWIRKL